MDDLRLPVNDAAAMACLRAMSMQSIAATRVREALSGADEIALVDVREAGEFGEGHPLFAVNIPYSRLELEAPPLLPRRSVRLVVMDGGDGVAVRAVRRLETLGYTNLSIMEAGAAGWARAGFTMFKGVHVPSKAFGELVEHARATPAIDAETLKTWQEGGARHLLLDARPPAEHARMCLPGAIGCPNAEIGHRLAALVRDASTPIVVHCAGRTRSIIGAESLRVLGIDNPVYALRNGTQGWQLAGLPLEHGSTALYPAIGPAERARSRELALRLRKREGVPTIDAARLRHWQADGERTLYLLDVRTPEEFAAGHLPGARHAPGGQLVQATDLWIAVRGARVVLCDDTGLRAALTAYWLRRMGHDAVVLDLDVSQAQELQRGSQAPCEAPATLPRLDASALADAIAQGAVVLDLNPGLSYRAGHISGARWAIRPRLDRLELDRHGHFVLAARDPRIAELAAVDLRELGFTHLSYSAGTPQDWRAAGLEVVATPDQPDDSACIDHLFFVHDRHDGNLAAARAYLDWETGLVEQLDTREREMFRP